MTPVSLVQLVPSLNLSDVEEAKKDLDYHGWAGFCAEHLAREHGVSVVTDLYSRCWLNLGEYGYIAQIMWNDSNLGKGWLSFPREGNLCNVQLLPTNMGIDIPHDVLGKFAASFT